MAMLVEMVRVQDLLTILVEEAVVPVEQAKMHNIPTHKDYSGVKVEMVDLESQLTLMALNITMEQVVVDPFMLTKQDHPDLVLV